MCMSCLFNISSYFNIAQYGLYSAYVGLFVYAVLGTCPQLSVGPTSILSLIVANTVSSVNGVSDVGDALFLSFFAGLIQMVMGIFRLGVINDFISEPVIKGFMAGAALTIVAGQLKVGMHCGGG